MIDLVNSRRPSPWPLHVALGLLTLGTIRFVERDVFHTDESIVQPVIEIASISLGGLIALGAFLYYRPPFAVKLSYLFLFAALLLTTASSYRSWNPLFSFVRGTLLLAISIASVLLLRTYGLRPFARSLLYANVTLVLLGVAVGLAMPAEYPLILRDPGEELWRARLHLFKIHPIALADSCAISLLGSVLLSDRGARICRFILFSVLLLTVARASIILCLPLYAMAAFAFSGRTIQGMKRLATFAASLLITLVGVVGFMVAFGGWSSIDDATYALQHLLQQTQDSTLNGRTGFWSILLSDLSVDNFYGYGVGGARYYLRTVNSSFSHSHNSALETVYMAGYLGLAAALAGILSGFVGCFQNWANPAARVTAICLTYIVLAGMMNPSWYETSAVIGLSVGCFAPWSWATKPSEDRARLAFPSRLSESWISR